MKQLTLIRHAAAQPQQFSHPDNSRHLTKIGQYQAQAIAKQLKARNCLPDSLVCSPAKRAVQTAEILCQHLELDPCILQMESILYSGDVEDILNLFRTFTTCQKLFLVGHNPTLSYLAHRLCPSIKTINLSTAGVISLRFDVENWNDLLTLRGELLFSIQP